MVSKLTIVRFLNRELRIREIPDVSRNGMQSNSGGDVKKVALAVDSSTEALKIAKSKGADLLIVHHGTLWKGLKDDFGVQSRVLSLCRKLRISLYAAHLPLDMHEKVGNNIELARILGLTDVKPFGDYHGMKIGFKGRTKARSIQNIARTLDRVLDARSVILPYGKKVIESVGIVSGGGSSGIHDAHREKLDLFVTGEAPHYMDVLSKEIRKSVIISGHYQTETLGVKALGRLLEERFKIKAVFLDLPTKV